MLGIHQRLGELWMVQKKRELSQAEQDEFIICLEANLKLAWKVAKLKNLSLVASMSGDVTWLHEISAQLDKLLTVQ